jgi:EamA domain-containing membrane protein RarD
MNNNIASYINNTLDFIYSNITFEAFVGLCVVYFFIIWIALIIWIIRDIRDRTDSIWFLILSISIILI